MAVIITEFQLDEFHGGNPLRVLDLGNGLNVALVRSDAGRLPLLQLVPWVLYGPGDYFSVNNETLAPGNQGAVTLRADHGVFRVERPWENEHDTLPTIVASDGQLYEPEYLENILDGLPHENYREVFTFDLARLGRFAATNPDGGGDAQSAEQLIRLADYLRRTSPQSSVATPISAPPPNLSGITSRLGELTNLIQSSSEIERARRSQEANRDRRPANREKVRQQLKKLEGEISAARAKWNQLQKESDQIQCVSAMARIQSQLRRVKREWKDAQAAKPAKAFSVNPETAARLEDKLKALRSELKELQSEAADLQRQGRDLGDLSRTSRLVPQMDALLIQEKSLVKEEAACEQLEDKIRDLETQIETERLRPAPPETSTLAPSSDVTANARLDQISERLRESQRELDIAEDRYERANHASNLAENSLRKSSSLASHPEDAVAIHEADARVAGLREILGLEDQLLRMEEDREDLEIDVQRLYANQLMPFQSLFTLGTLFVLGVGMIIYGLTMKQPGTDWRLVTFGFFVAIATSLIKISMDQGTRDLLARGRERLSQLNYQINEIAGAREQSAVSGVSLERQLQEAERDLSRLQTRFASRDPDMLPTPVGMDTNAETARLQWEHAQQRQLELTGQWRNLMIELGLSPDLNLTDARESLTSRTRVTVPTHDDVKRYETAQSEFQLQHFRRDLDRRRDWLGVISGQTRQLISELGFSGTVTGIGEQMDVLREALSEHKEKSQARREISRSLKRLKEKIRRVKESGRRVTEQRSKLDEDVKLNEKRAKAEQKLRKDRVQALERDRERLEQDLTDIRNQYNVQSKSNLAELAELGEDELVSRMEGLQRKLEKAQDQLLKLTEQRGRFRAELNATEHPRDEESDDLHIAWHELMEKAGEISQECELTESTPQTVSPHSQAKYVYLEQASEYLRRLSGGQFWQIESPHEQDLLLTDHTGNVLRLDEVRREHYANLYFSLWLARLEAYADQKMRLPIIMEDPLEATDPQRKPVVAALLRDIAAQGHQVILVTSESFNASIFSQLDVPIADLSDREVIATANGQPTDAVEEKAMAFETAHTPTSPIGDSDEPLFPPA